MSLQRILSEVRTYDDLLEIAPPVGSEHPEIAWGDHFFYYAPDARVPRNRQPYATIVMKDYPDDTASRLNADGRWRLNIHVGAEIFTEVLGYPPADVQEKSIDYTATDVFLPHPVYGAYGWVSIVNPGDSTIDRARDLLRGAHAHDRRRVERRSKRG
jgi:hypothetical protein